MDVLDLSKAVLLQNYIKSPDFVPTDIKIKSTNLSIKEISERTLSREHRNYNNVIMFNRYLYHIKVSA